MELSTRKTILDSAQTCVVKVGSRVLTGPDGRLDRDQVGNLASQLTTLTEQGRQVVLVSSGAVASGVGKLGLPARPTDLAVLQAVAAVGQAHLIQTYEQFFSARGKHAGQVLLIADDLDDRIRYLNVRNTLLQLLRLGVIPIINENDTVAVDELMTTFGDNDRLAAMVAGLLPRPVLVILSDVQGLYDRDPTAAGATVIPSVEQIDQSIMNLVIDRRTGLSKGGMGSKLRAAQFVTSSGSPVIIAGGRMENILPRLFDGEEVGTLFMPQSRSLAPRKRWIGFTAQAAGKIHIDEGAAKAIVYEGRSLLAIGIKDVSGQFEKGDVVAIVDGEDEEIARGLVNYTAAEVRQIRGCRSPRIAEILGHRPYEEVVHRDNMALVGLKTSSPES
ncbi:MAG: glutamate 5-kinase [Pirellulaceae bacterium]|nr:glutamate 5-kinase [Pirellulaceae bacterium]